MAKNHISQDSRDQELVDVSKAFVAAETDYNRVNRERGRTMSEAEQFEIDAARDGEQAARVARMGELRATSIRGFKARAAALLAMETVEMLEEEAAQEGDDGARLRLFLARDLAAA